MEGQFWIPSVNHNGHHLDVYSSMLADGIIFVNARIDQRIAGLITSCLLQISSNIDVVQKPQIYLNTKLGDLVAAMSVVDIIEFYKNRDITIQTMGFGEIGIAGGLILTSGSKGFRKMATHSQLSLYLGVDNLEFGGVQSAEAKSIQAEKMRRISIELLSKYSGQDKDEFRIRTNREDYLDGRESKRLGLIDDII
jgi:ATP-dependent Clp endopeptidase proteolytic subunit ClpP